MEKAVNSTSGTTLRLFNVQLNKPEELTLEAHSLAGELANDAPNVETWGAQWSIHHANFSVNRDTKFAILSIRFLG